MQTNANTSVVSQEVNTWSAWASRANNAYIGFLALTLIATVLIVFFNNRLNKAKDELSVREKRASEEKVAALTKEAEIAKKERAETDLKAETARERASTAEEKAGEIEKQNLQLRTDLEAATTESRTKQAELATEQAKLSAEQRKTAEAQRAADIARLALQKHLEEVAERQKPRHLSLEQQERFVAELKPVAGEIEVSCEVGNKESCDFAEELRALLIKSGWATGLTNQKVHTRTTKEGLPFDSLGIFVFVKSMDRLPRRAVRLFDAVLAFDPSARSGIGEQLNEDGVELFVGHKP